MSPSTLKIMDEKFIVSCRARAEHDTLNILVAHRLWAMAEIGGCQMFT